MTEVVGAAGEITAAATTRLNVALLEATPPRAMDHATLAAQRDELLAHG